MTKLTQYQSDPAIEIVTGVCPHDCPDTCSWQVAVERATGRAVDIWGHPDHPVTQGKLCGKVDRYLERTYHQGRLTTPLRRVGPQGQRPVCARHLGGSARRHRRAPAGRSSPQTARRQCCPTRMPARWACCRAKAWRRASSTSMGASLLERTICSEAGFEGYIYTIGAAEGMETEAYAHARLILIWGSNTLTSNLHLWPFVQQARKQGARVIVIDPANTRTAQAADEWIADPPRHGRRAGAGHDARHHRRRAVRRRLCRALYRSALTHWRSGWRIGLPNGQKPSPAWRPSGSVRWRANTPGSSRRPSGSTMGCSATTAAAWPCARLPACRRSSAHGAATAAASSSAPAAISATWIAHSSIGRTCWRGARRAGST